MKFWKGKVKTAKENKYGTMDDDGFVPDSIIIEKYQYDILQILNKPIKPINEYSKLITIEDKINFIANKLNLIGE